MIDVLPGTARVHICDYCQRIELSAGRWIACHPAQLPPARLLDQDICPECCATYVSFLLAPDRETETEELAMPAFRRRS